jgi:hypothetical protein
MPTETANILSQVSNSGVVQMPGRRFPGIVMQGDTLSNVFDSVRFLLAEFKARRDEERFFETLMFAEQLQGQLLQYEQTLSDRGMGLPYTVSIRERLVSDDYEKAEPGGAPNGGPATPRGNSGVTDGPPSVS